MERLVRETRSMEKLIKEIQSNDVINKKQLIKLIDLMIDKEESGSADLETRFVRSISRGTLLRLRDIITGEREG